MYNLTVTWDQENAQIGANMDGVRSLFVSGHGTPNMKGQPVRLAGKTDGHALTFCPNVAEDGQDVHINGVFVGKGQLETTSSYEWGFNTDDNTAQSILVHVSKDWVDIVAESLGKSL